ncbi:hypothetical protein [Streptomyces sp. AVP053U2]|uniref:hypothetical protein n=1 Tax=Streptomyces sp. AVP053U2 TaxID=1737066 RepID=UPI00073CB398|nr:hypothetical protein [Streptomyces sp. AVP053U2]ODA69822.1 hypothetical protein APS67_006039 [Streptomyces sp. AVP053U2]
MGTGSKSSHQSYAVSPTALAEAPAASLDITGAPVAGEGADLAGVSAGASGEAAFEVPELPEPVVEPASPAEPPVDEDPLAELDGLLGIESEPEPVAAAAPSEEEAQEASAEGELQSSGEEPSAEEDVLLQAEDIEEVEEEEEETDPPLTPVPAAPPVGEPTGTPILVGGDDFINSEATLVAYDSPDGPREVLLTHISEEAEEKLLDALSIPGTHMEEIQVEEEVKERLDLDKEKKLAELTKSAITSVQHKLKGSLPMSDASIAKHQAAVDAVSAVLNDPSISDDEKAMAQHYMDQLDVVKDKIDNGGSVMPWMDAYEVTATKMVTKQIPVPDGDPEPGTLAATVRKASRIQANLDPATGQTSWDGVSRSSAKGTEYEIDMGDGWKAVYRPYKDNDPANTEFSLRGQLEVHAPAGAGHGKDLVDRLEQLHLMNKPMTAAEGEWTYLANNIQAQGLEGSAGMKAAMETAQALQDLQVQEIVHQRMESLMGLDSDALQTAMKRIHLEASHKVLPMKVEVVRDAVAKASGFSSGAELAASPGYEPTPSTGGKWLTWSRFDVTGKKAEIQSAFEGRSLSHNLNGGDLASLLGVGVLASTEKRAVMGIGGGLGLSEQADKMTGGANSVFLRVKKTPSSPGGGRLIWDDPSVLMQRSDYYAYNGDHYGAINPAHHNYNAGAITRDPMKIAKFTGSSNEIMFRNGIDLLGAEAPSRIVCHTAAERSSILASLTARGITQLGGKPVEDVLCTESDY